MLVFFAQKRFLVSWGPICELLDLNACVNKIMFRKFFPVLVCSNVFPIFFLYRFRVSGLILRSLIHLGLLLYMVGDRDLVSFYYM